MGKYIFLFLFTITTSMTVNGAEKKLCNDPIPKIFQRVSPSVVLVSTVAINPYKITSKFSSSIGSGFIISEDVFLNNQDRYEEVVESLKIGDKVRLKIFREGKIFEALLDIVERPILPSDLLQDDQQIVSQPWKQ